MTKGFLARIFSRKDSSTTNAKSRLHFVLVQDRSGLQPEELNSFRKEMIAVIEKYFEINEQDFGISYERSDETTTLVINSPVTLKRVVSSRFLPQKSSKNKTSTPLKSDNSPSNLALASELEEEEAEIEAVPVANSSTVEAVSEEAL